MIKLYKEIARRFPEITNEITRQNRDLPYVQMAYVIGWLNDMSEETLTPEIAERIQQFAKWCEEQPRGADASDDLYTILVVAFYEKMFRSERTRALLPRILSREAVIANSEYYKSWAGAENYEKALQEYDRSI